MENYLAFLVTPTQAKIAFAAFQCLEAHCEEAIHAGGFIDEDEKCTSNLLDVIRMAEEAKIMRGQLLLRFGLCVGNEN